MIARPSGLLVSLQIWLAVDRIQYASEGSPLASTMTSVLWPTDKVTKSVVYGSIGVKSFAITVKVWLSIEKRVNNSAPVLTKRSKCFFPEVNRNWERLARLQLGASVQDPLVPSCGPPILSQLVEDVTFLQGYIPFPLINVASEYGRESVEVPLGSDSTFVTMSS